VGNTEGSNAGSFARFGAIHGARARRDATRNKGLTGVGNAAIRIGLRVLAIERNRSMRGIACSGLFLC